MTSNKPPITPTQEHTHTGVIIQAGCYTPDLYSVVVVVDLSYELPSAFSCAVFTRAKERWRLARQPLHTYLLEYVMYVVIMCLETLHCYIVLIYHFIYLITFDIQRVRKKKCKQTKTKTCAKKIMGMCEDDRRRKKIGLKEGREGRRKWEEGRRIWRGHKSPCTVNVATHESPTFLISSGWETEVVSWRGNMKGRQWVE